MSVKSKFALGAVVGAAAGVIAGLLTAPKSGKDTRADIKNKAQELKRRKQHTSPRIEQPKQVTTPPSSSAKKSVK